MLPLVKSLVFLGCLMNEITARLQANDLGVIRERSLL